MPKMTREIVGTDLCITRPVVLDVVRQLCIQLDLPKGLEVEFAGDNPTPITTGSAISNNVEDIDFSTGAKVKVNYKEQPTERSWFQTHDFTRYQNSILSDSRIKTTMYPIRDVRKVEIGLVFRFNSRSKAQKTLNFVRNRIARLKKNYTHSVTYAYPLPDDIIATLFAIQDVKENKFGYGETPREWLDAKSNEALTSVSNLIGREQTLAVEVTDVGLIGALSDELVPSRDRGSKGITYHFTSTYSFYYAPPISVVLEYPMFIHQQGLPKKYRGVRNDLLTETVDTTYNPEFRYLIKLSNDRDPIDIADGITIPSWDEWHDRFDHTLDTVRLYNVMLSLGDEALPDSNKLLDLRDLPHSFSDATWAWIEAYPQYVNVKGRTPVLIQLWHWNEVVSPTEYEIRSDGTVHSKIPLDRRVNFHITVTLEKKLGNLALPTQELLKKHPEFCNEVIQFDKPGYVIPEIVPGVIVDRDWMPAIEPEGLVRGQRARMVTVQNSILVALKEGK